MSKNNANRCLSSVYDSTFYSDLIRERWVVNMKEKRVHRGKHMTDSVSCFESTNASCKITERKVTMALGLAAIYTRSVGVLSLASRTSQLPDSLELTLHSAAHFFTDLFLTLNLHEEISRAR